MVFFCCDGCGETLKKNQVDVHANRCRRCESVSCVDCGVSYFGDDYRSHTFCMTEAERYEGKDSVKRKTKATPQELWTDLIQSASQSAPPHIRNHLQTMASLDNVPRNEKKFRNWSKNSLRNANDSVIAEIWKYLQDQREKEQKAISDQKQLQSTQPGTKKLEASNANSPETCKTKQNKDKDISVSKKGDAVQCKSTSEPTPKANSKTVRKAMKKVLKKARDKSLTLKSLRKEVRLHLDLPSSEKSLLKKIVQQALEDSKKQEFRLDGSKVSLRVD